jgi:hypothetical protein
LILDNALNMALYLSPTYGIGVDEGVSLKTLLAQWSLTTLEPKE